MENHIVDHMEHFKWYPHLLCFSTSNTYFRSAFLLFMCVLLVSVQQGQILLLFWEQSFLEKLFICILWWMGKKVY